MNTHIVKCFSFENLFLTLDIVSYLGFGASDFSIYRFTLDKERLPRPFGPRNDRIMDSCPCSVPGVTIFRRNDRRPETTYEIRNTRYESKVSFDEAGIDFIFQIQIV